MRDIYATGLRLGLDTSSYVDAVTEDIVAVDDDVAQVDSDTITNALFLRHFRFAFSDRTLDCNGAANGIHDAGKLDEQTIAGRLYDAPVMFSDSGIYQLAAVKPLPRNGPFLVNLHEARVSNHVGSEHSGQPSFFAPRRHGSRSR